MSTRRGRGFTIVELLVVIGILALLMGMLLPALNSVQKKSSKAREVNSLRQVGIAWQLYTNSSNDKILPGYLEDLVQSDWHVSSQFRDGSTVLATLARPYTWRLMPYLDYNHEMIHGHIDEADFNPLSMSQDNVLANEEFMAEATAIAYEPAFGYNAYYVGGWPCRWASTRSS